ncbi:helix-turn-helix transcriptional regulator [Xylanimonas ulmi]|uniref:AlpA family transcriptional regulator n=1 Tax=Xylanimonas ulmi TaxID=228973 RepID=A0A4Q7M005_9MICO|nr:helix-turn-helix domain-containing protein [Xylanibacterium ulmi]RZS60441.1 AlpA family transcriptional regulator [Xylanibacterium ulmi]
MKLIDKKAVAALTGTSDATVTDWVYRGVELGPLSIKLGRRRVWDEERVLRWLNDRFAEAEKRAS